MAFILPLAAVAAVILLAKIGASWLANRDNTASNPAIPSTSRATTAAAPNTPEGKAEMMRQQIIAKVRWGARDREVLDWLQERHNITGEKADALLAEAHRAKRKAVRQKAVIMLICSGLGVLFFGGLIALQFWGGYLLIGLSAAVVWLLALTSAATFLRHAWLLITGRTDGSVD